MRGAIHLGAILAFAIAAAPAAAQTVPGQVPSEDQTSHSVPPAPPPERRAQTPPPFPSFPYVEPKRHHAQTRAHASRSTHERRRRAKAAEHRIGDHAAAERPLTKREKKDQRYCASLSHRQMRKNSKCRKIEQKSHETAAPRPLTRQERKDEQRCAKLSLRQVLRDSRCRKVAERQLEAEHYKSGRARHGHAKARHKGVHREAHRKSAKRRR